MPTLAPARRQVKPIRVSPRPAAPFGFGILEPAAAAIPATVDRIKVVSGVRAGTYARVTDLPGWADHWRSEGADGRWLAEDDADTLYRLGKVAILEAPRPAPQADAAFSVAALPTLADADNRPAPTARGRKPYTAADLAWEAGHTAGLNDGEPIPPAHLTDAEKAAWLAGFDQGWATFRDREDAQLEDLALAAEWAEWAEARAMPPHGEIRD